MRWFNYLAVLALGAVFVILGIHNSSPVTFHFVYGSITVPVIALFIVAFSLGALMTVLIFGVKAFFWRMRAQSLRNQLKEEHAAADDAQVRAEFQADRSAS